ncbi:MAG TPA: hypothetical protein VMT85_01570 [Thermoanaerobaculia bacterium]|nr:hypothetical protein [Thermoanaerobaculia bacterium]
MSDAYDTVELKPSWLGCSLISIGLLVLFAVSLPFLIRSFRLQEFFFEALLLFPVASLLGTLCGWMAVRRTGARSLAGIALLANLTVFGSCVAAVVITILRR